MAIENYLEANLEDIGKVISQEVAKEGLDAKTLDTDFISNFDSGKIQFALASTTAMEAPAIKRDLQKYSSEILKRVVIALTDNVEEISAA